MAAPTISGRVGIAFDDPALEPDPTFTWLDQDYDNLVASWSIDRGRQFELDRTDAARATVTINDKDGILDPTNPTGPFWFKIEPLLQIVLGAWNPVAEEWQSRFRGWVGSWTYTQHPSQVVMQATIEVVDIFDMLAAVEMLPGEFGDEPPLGSEGQIFFDAAGAVDARMASVMTSANIDEAFYVFFTGNVDLVPTVYAPGESPMTVIQESADAEFPCVSNVYTDRFGRLVFHGRLAKFDPSTIAAGAGDEAWDWRHWRVGDGEAVASEPTQVAQLREFGFGRGIDTIRNKALATPIGILDADVAGQIATDGTSIGLYGIRSWSAQNLLTGGGVGTTALEETKLFADYIVANYSTPANRIAPIVVKTMHPDAVGAGITSMMLTRVDIADQVDVSVLDPGGGGVTEYECFVEGVRETLEPLNGDYDMHTVTLDLSPKALFDTDPWS